MPKLIPPATCSDMERFAFDVFKDAIEGPGTTAARVRRLHDVMNSLAQQNYDAGLAEGKKPAVTEQKGPADVPGQQTIADLPGVVAGTASGCAPAPAEPVSGGVG